MGNGSNQLVLIDYNIFDNGITRTEFKYLNNVSPATIANNEYVAHSLAGTPTTVTLTPRAVTYGTPTVTFVVAVTARSSSTFTVTATWTNRTAIMTDAIVIDWIAYYVL